MCGISLCCRGELAEPPTAAAVCNFPECSPRFILELWRAGKSGGVSLLRPSLPSCFRQFCLSLTYSGFPLPPLFVLVPVFLLQAPRHSSLPSARTQRKELAVVAAWGGWKARRGALLLPGKPSKAVGGAGRGEVVFQEVL